MSSINTNLSAMIALDTLKGINRDLGQVQNAISTGKSINSAKDNAAIWSIATTMETDVAGFDKISDSLNLASATIGVARNTSEDLVTYLQDTKDLIISAQESNVDRGKIQTDIDELVKQVSSTVSAAQFNGQNLLSSNGSITALSSLNRASDGSVTASRITVERQNLTFDAATSGALASSAPGGISLAPGSIPPGGPQDVFTINTGVVEGNVYTVEGGLSAPAITVTAEAGDDNAAIATKIVNALATASDPGLTFAIKSGIGNENIITATNSGMSANAASIVSQTTITEASGALNGFDTIDVTTDSGAQNALTAIEGFIASAIDAAASFGSKQRRIDNQADFVSSLSDSLKTGISTLTDANLEETSARLQALQVQQQLGIQALSIANQAPSALLGLFR